MAAPVQSISSQPNRYYRPELDALRFFAFLSVFGFHLLDYISIDARTHPLLNALCTAGAFGVPVFFLLSSFLIVELLLRERKQTGDIHIKSFYVRRILRIWPLYFAVFYGLVALGHFLPEVGPKTFGSWIAFTFFAGNWYIMRFDWIAGAVDPLWSIAVEEQFYIAVPVLSRIGGRKLLAAISILLIGISYVVSVHYARLVYSGESGQWVNSWFQFQFFAAGALLAIALHGRVPRWPIVVRAMVFVLAVGCWMYAVIATGVRSYDGHPTVAGAIGGWTLVLAGTILFFLAALGTPQHLVPRWLTYLGRISYGLYMFHSLVFHLVFQFVRPFLDRHLNLPASAVSMHVARARRHDCHREHFLSIFRAPVPQAQTAVYVCSLASGIDPRICRIPLTIWPVRAKLTHRMSTALHHDFVAVPAEATRVLTSAIRISSIIGIIRAIESAAAM
jgi:peptidoglycan/LPS O-acetylase OafA/YrhL